MPCREHISAIQDNGSVLHQQPASLDDRNHPKRCPAYLSVCLRPSSSGHSAFQARQLCVGSQSSVSTEIRTPLNGDGNATNARTWFENSNKNASSTGAVPFLDSEFENYPIV